MNLTCNETFPAQ